MDFEQRLQRAIERGERARDEEQKERSKAELSEEEYKDLYSKHRIDATDHIEANLRQLSDHFPGFRYQTIVGREGWGAKISRDDLQVGSSGRQNLYSRLELLVSPFSDAKIIEIVVKGTIRNREVLSRSHYQRLAEVDPDLIRTMIDQWVLEYAEQFAAAR